MYHSFHTKILIIPSVLTLILIRNVSCAPTQHVRMISEGSCDTEDWSNDDNHRRSSCQDLFPRIDEDTNGSVDCLL